jgi:hypothetical protein
MGWEPAAGLYGTDAVHVDGELAQLDADGYGPLRAAAGAL